MPAKEFSQIIDTKDFREFYLQMIEPVRNFLYYKCGDLQQAEDLAQEAFIRLWENRKKVESGKAKNFVYTIANNLFLNAVKHQKVVMEFESTHKKGADEENPQYLMEMEEFRLKLEQAISTLPEKQREVFLMNRIDKLTYREIAERIGISQKAVEKRMHLALQQLRKLSKKL